MQKNLLHEFQPDGWGRWRQALRHGGIATSGRLQPVTACIQEQPAGRRLPRTAVGDVRRGLVPLPYRMSSSTSAAAPSVEVAPAPPFSVKRKASSSLSELLRRLSHSSPGWNSADEHEYEPEESVSPRSFSMRLQKVMRIIGLSNSDREDEPQLPPAEPGLAPAQPPPVVASLSQCSGIGVDDIAELSLEELVDKASPPLSPHVPTPTPS